VICSCGASVRFTPATVRGVTVFEESYLLFVDCVKCDSTCNVTLWESEEQALYVEPRGVREAIAAE
jgi:hypothetical protein